MLDIYFWTTPNGYKVLLFAEEAGVPYTIKPVNIGRGVQFQPDFLRISPNNRIPALVDHAPAEGKAPLSVFESGAILLYLAEKTRRFIPANLAGRVEVLQWLFWQMGGLGPMAGQNHHFSHYAPEKLPYAVERYVNETNRLYGVMNKRLAERDYLAGDYSIADMASYPWVAIWKRLSQTMDEFPHLMRWIERMRARSAVDRAYKAGENIAPPRTGGMSEEEKKVLFGQTAATVTAAVRP